MNNNNALLIIDMQQEDGFVLENLDRVVAHTAALLDTARHQRMPVIYIAKSYAAMISLACAMRCLRHYFSYSA